MSAVPEEPEIVQLPEEGVEVEMDEGYPDWKRREDDRMEISVRTNALDTMGVAWVSQVSQCHEILLGAHRPTSDEPWKEASAAEESKKIETAHEKVRLAAAAKLIRLLGDQYDPKSAWLNPIPEAEA